MAARLLPTPRTPVELVDGGRVVLASSARMPFNDLDVLLSPRFAMSGGSDS
jgi:hypothetical protein